MDEIKSIILSFEQQLLNTKNIELLAEVKQNFLGKNGLITKLFKNIANQLPDQKIAYGKKLNEAKNLIEQSLIDQKNKILTAISTQIDATNWLDVTIPTANQYGAMHPISVIQYKLEDIFSAMGFEVLDGPHIESDYYNFQALNFPLNHPARDAQDTYYLTKELLLRTHTSSIQIHTMETRNPPFKIVGPGRVFRAERIDASHSSVFHQIEGIMVDRNISVANMMYFIKIMLSQIYEDDLTFRFRPGYFPFVEPGFEVDIACSICKSKGCTACKQTGWVEILGCGMTHPNVLKAGNIDPSEYRGFAFGMGIDRLAMLKYQINDIRLLSGGSLAVNEQFSGNN